ncbi:MAG: glycosyltransferase family 2 protein [Gemmatimonadaceae bacterium]|nr:glycosyltransferase family 2 protein [Gemmatimonadaceae bacterium]
MKEPRWTLAVLTVPGRERYLDRLAESVRALPSRDGVELLVVHNAATEIDLRQLERRLRAKSGLRCRAVANASEPTIAAGRRMQVAVSRTPLLCFLDDDCTVHGDIFAALERELQRMPVGALGLPSVDADTGEPFKPRTTTPSVEHDGLRFMPIQGMLVATYRRLLIDVGDFAKHRRYWGEWTELNTRLWRMGYATAYVMNAGQIRHWTRAPGSPTRDLTGRERNIVWGLLCTALEYDLVQAPDDLAFWQLVQSRYLPYAYDRTPTGMDLLRTLGALAPQLAAEWGAIAAHAERARTHPFQFSPFHEWTETDVRLVLDGAAERLASYRSEAFPAVAPSKGWRWWRRTAPVSDGASVAVS